MAKKRKYSSKKGGYKFNPEMEHGYERAWGHIMTHNGNMGLVKEDFSKPCGIPYGAISKDVGNANYMPLNGYRANDLFEGVEKSMKNDSDAIRRMTKPTNW